MNPGGFWTGPSEESGHGVDENRKYSLSPKSAGLAQGQDSLGKTSTLLADSAKTDFSPQYGKTQKAFGVIVRRGDTGFPEKLKKTQKMPREEIRKALANAREVDDGKKNP